MTGRALIAWLAVASVGCSLQKNGTGDDMSLGGPDTSIDDSVAAIETSIADSAEEDTFVEDTTLPPDAVGDTGTEDVMDSAFDAVPESESGSALTMTCTEVAPSDVNLTTEGTVAWAHWGLVDTKSFDHKSTSTAISDVTVTGGSAFAFGGFAMTASWTDGTPTATTSKTKTGIYVGTSGAKFSFTASGDGALRTLRIYLQSRFAAGTVTAAIGTSTAVGVVPSTSMIRYYACETTFATFSAVQLTITQTSSGSASISLLSATLQ